MMSGYRGRAVGFAKWAAAIATVVAVWSVTDAPSSVATAQGRGGGGGPRPRRRSARQPDPAARRHAAAGGPLHQQELLPGREVLARQALHPVQHAAGPDRHGPRPAVRRLGRLQPGPGRGQDRQPAPVQDRAGALRGAAGRGEEGGRADGPHPPDDAGVGRLVPAAGPRRAVGLGPQPPDRHHAVAADARNIAGGWCSRTTTRW